MPSSSVAVLLGCVAQALAKEPVTKIDRMHDSDNESAAQKLSFDKFDTDRSVAADKLLHRKFHMRPLHQTEHDMTLLGKDHALLAQPGAQASVLRPQSVPSLALAPLAVRRSSAAVEQFPPRPRGTAAAASRDGGLWNDARAAVLPVLASLAILSSSLTVVPPGQMGIVNTFGATSTKTFTSGLHLKAPVSDVRLISVKTQLAEEKNFVPTQEGLTVELDTALLYHLDPTKVRDLFINVGEDYENIIIQPEVRSVVRGLTSEADAKALYTSGRNEIQRKIKEELSERLGRRGIVVEDVLLKAVKLPKQLTSAIEMKAQAEQEAQRMEFILQKERQEAERKQIEAEGIAKFQKIVSNGISPELLKWKGIEATEKLAESSNAKVVIMGNGKNSLPVLMNSDTDGK
eukprot:gnl/TRDRNA2_/TRDRNA2_191901_c0_seq1.p1 gnl/TRDRNA2_/TRDRNA2_191901_c0~~gnl/TRDRNA2_/TRDRNA2_191901_c0_seq1.p1  ORF type:complete len:403 (-),score=70.40 gnl/TRDRNA2_/TRDRNA2_191901_c0_seq1:54-1262(-)